MEFLHDNSTGLPYVLPVAILRIKGKAHEKQENEKFCWTLKQ
jgi:hypothetical protein